MPAEWEEIARDRFHAATPQRTVRRSVGINLPEELMPFLQRAAQARDMSVGAYMRRAALAFAAFDLHTDWDVLMADEPRIQDYNGDRPAAESNGRGFGNWKIIDLGEYRDDADDS